MFVATIRNNRFGHIMCVREFPDIRTASHMLNMPQRDVRALIESKSCRRMQNCTMTIEEVNDAVSDDCRIRRDDPQFRPQPETSPRRRRTDQRTAVPHPGHLHQQS